MNPKVPSTPSASEPAHFEGKLDGDILLNGAGRAHFSKAKAIKKRANRTEAMGGSKEFFDNWVDYQAAIDAAMAEINVPGHPDLLETMPKSEISVSGNKVTMRRNFESKAIKFVRDQLPTMCVGRNTDEVASLLGLRFEAEQLQMHIYQRRIYAILTVIAVQQATGGKRNPLGSSAVSQRHDWDGVRSRYGFSEDEDTAPPRTPHLRTKDEELEAELALISASRNAEGDDNDGVPDPEEKLPSKKELKAEKVRADSATRKAMDAQIKKILAAQQEDPGGKGKGKLKRRRIESSDEDSDEEEAARERQHRRRTKVGDNGASSSATDGKFTMPSSAMIAVISERKGAKPSEDQHMQPDESLVKMLARGEPPTVAAVWAKVQSVTAEDQVLNIGPDGQISATARSRGAEPRTIEDLFRVHQLLLACINDVEGATVFAREWLGVFTFTITEASTRSNRDVAKVSMYYNKHFRYAWKSLADNKWTDLQLDRVMLAQVSTDLDARRRQASDRERESRGRTGPAHFGGHGQGFGGQRVQPRARVFNRPVPDEMARTVCANFTQGRPCALVTPSGACVFYHPRPPPVPRPGGHVNDHRRR